MPNFEKPQVFDPILQAFLSRIGYPSREAG